MRKNKRGSDGSFSEGAKFIKTTRPAKSDTNVRFVTYMEQGKMRVSDKFYIPLRKIGVDPFQLAIEQECFICWRREFYFCLDWGTTPSHIG